MRLDEWLAQAETAEDIFERLGLEPDPRVLAVHRLHILRRFGRKVAEIDSQADALADDERWRRYAAALKWAHEQYEAGGGAQEPVFSGTAPGLVRLRLGAHPGKRSQ